MTHTVLQPHMWHLPRTQQVKRLRSQVQKQQKYLWAIYGNGLISQVSPEIRESLHENVCNSENSYDFWETLTPFGRLLEKFYSTRLGTKIYRWLDIELYRIDLGNLEKGTDTLKLLDPVIDRTSLRWLVWRMLHVYD